MLRIFFFLGQIQNDYLIFPGITKHFMKLNRYLNDAPDAEKCATHGTLGAANSRVKAHHGHAPGLKAKKAFKKETRVGLQGSML
jgi:hypothetical protein